MNNAGHPAPADDLQTFAGELAKFPAALRDLLTAEVQAGNQILEINGTFPAPPVGLCARLARQVTTRPRASFDGIRFFERSSSSSSGEFFDANRMYFVLEPPLPPPPEPDMDEIRRKMEEAERAANADRFKYGW